MSSTNSARNRKTQEKDNNVKFSSDKSLNKTPQNSLDTENESPPQKSTSRILKHLESSLSPKYIEFNGTIGGQRSRYGREHKYKETDGFLPTEVVYAYHRVGKAVAKSEIKQNTNLIMIKPLRKHDTAEDNFYESPIEKLITKNKKLILGSSAEFSTSTDLFEKTKKRLFTSLTDDSSSILLSPQKILVQSSTPNGVLDIDTKKVVESVSPILKPIETSTPKSIEKPVRILKKVDDPEILKNLKVKLAASIKLPIKSVTINEKNQLNLNQATKTNDVVLESSPIVPVRKLDKVHNSRNVASSKLILPQSPPIEKVIEQPIVSVKKLEKIINSRNVSSSKAMPIVKVLDVHKNNKSLSITTPTKKDDISPNNAKSIVPESPPIKLGRKLEKSNSPRIAESSKSFLTQSQSLNTEKVIDVLKTNNQPISITTPEKIEDVPLNIAKPLVRKSPPIKLVEKSEKFISPRKGDSSIPILTTVPAIESQIENIVKKNSLLSVDGLPKKEDSPRKNIKYKLSLNPLPTRKLEAKEIPVEKKLTKSPKPVINPDNSKIFSGSDQIVLNSIKEGDLFWARLASYPYWPCMVASDDKKTIIQDTVAKKVHVKFFADNGRRCWVSLSSVIPYKGLDDFHARKAVDEADQTVYPKKKQKTGRKIKPFVIPPFQIAKWESAVKEADEVFTQPSQDRLNTFESILKRNIDMKKQNAALMRRQRKSQLKRPRSRSPTPECPPFELIGFTPKKIKMESNSTDLAAILNLASDIGKDVALSFLMNDTANLTSPGAETFYNNFENRFLSNDESLLINKEHLEDFTKKLWNLKNNNLDNNIIKIEIKDEQLSENSIPDDGSGVGITSLRSSISSGSTSSVPDTNMTEFSKNYLFKKLSREFVCRICFKTKNLLKCEGACNGWYHDACVNGSTAKLQPDQPVESRKKKRKPIGNSIETVASSSLQEFLCMDCKNELIPACFVCKQYDGDESMERRLKCRIHGCGRFYHTRCLKYFPQAKSVEGNLICPAHSCHTCISDDPKGKYVTGKFSYVKCVVCPASYHMDSTCIPAGTEFITAIQIICPKHREYSKQQNCNWCFICATGGNLVCCETCPTAFHPECLKIPLDEQGYICEECETGRMPLYGEIVWAKFSRYRWWPAQIIPPPAVPDSMNRVSRKKADFCVKFFGSNNYAWINRGRVYLYQEGDWGKTKNNRGIEKQYENALVEAKTMYELLNQQKLMRKDEKKDQLRPLPYIKIKTNKVVPPVRLVEDELHDMNPCLCDPKDEDPCGPYSGCLNRLLMFECHPAVCPARERCMNQMFEKRLYPNLQVKRTDLRGWGLVTLEDLRPGRFIVEYVGEIIDNDEFKRRVKKMQETKEENYYFLTMIKELMIDAGPKGNVSRFMNHSCEPNCETQKWSVNGITRVGLFAIVDIPANTELTFNYNLECIGNVKKPCYCGASKCSGFIGAKSKAATLTKKIKRRNSSTSKKGDRK